MKWLEAGESCGAVDLGELGYISSAGIYGMVSPTTPGDRQPSGEYP